jgi:acetyl esterase/lipase
MRLKFIFSLIVVAALLVAGCGGSDSSSSSGGTGASGTESSGSTDGTTTNTSGNTNANGGAPLTKAAFIKQGDAICAKIPEEYEAKRQELLKGPEKAKATTEKVNEVAAVPPIFVAVKSFEELTPPKGEEAEAEAIVDALEAAGKGLEKEPNAPLVGKGSPYEEFQKLTKEYGFTFCNEL